MILLGKIEEMKKAKIKAFEREFRRKYPEESPEVIHKMAERKYQRNHRQFLAKAKVALMTAILTLGITLGAQGIFNASNATTPQISYEYLTEEQKSLIDSLDGQQLIEYIESYNVSAHPAHMYSASENKKAQEINENSEEYLKEFREFQEGLLPFFASYQVHPEKYTEEQMLKALDASNQLLGRYTKNQVANLLYQHNQTNSDKDLRLILLPDPGDINFYEVDVDTHSLACTEYSDSGLILKENVYIGHQYFKDNGFDEAIDNFFNVTDYLDNQRSRIDDKSNDKSHMDKTIEMILGNNGVADQVKNTEVTVKNHWFNALPTFDFEYKEEAKDKEADKTAYVPATSEVEQTISTASTPTKDDGPEL